MIVVESPEHEELRSAICKVLAAKAPLARTVADTERPAGYDPALWRLLARELGVVGLSVPERFGGAGAGALEESIVAGELGAAPAATPYLSTIALAANLLLASGDEAAGSRYLPSLMSAERTAAVIVRGWSGAVGRPDVPLAATETAHGWRVDGRARFVIDGHSADVILLAARAGRAVRLFAVEADARGLTRERMTTMDSLRPMAQLRFDAVAAEPFGPDDGWPPVERMLDLATVALAAEQAAGAQAALDQTVKYAGLRVQFARTIASFQAVKHRCAETFVANDRARSAVVHAVWAADHDPARLPAAAAMAALVCGPAFRHAATENVQLHGGIGFTWEHPAHRYFRRATADTSLLADRRWYEDRLLAGIGVATPRTTA
jgi:alkylation response protein AidB-like acyl-CoA dehydrogenase